jgi:hypothetical protein
VGKGEDRLTGAVSLVYGLFAMSLLFGMPGGGGDRGGQGKDGWSGVSGRLFHIWACGGVLGPLFSLKRGGGAGCDSAYWTCE